MNLQNFNKLIYFNNGLFYTLHCNGENVTKNKDLARALDIEEKELTSFLKFNACQAWGADYIIMDGQDIDELLNRLKAVFADR